MNMKWKMFIAVSGVRVLQKNSYDDRHPSIPPKKPNDNHEHFFPFWNKKNKTETHQRYQNQNKKHINYYVQNNN